MDLDVLVVALAVLGFGLVAGRLRGTALTLPMVFAGVGLVLGPRTLGVLDLQVYDEAVSVLAEATLALVLFTDDSRMTQPWAVRAASAVKPAHRVDTRATDSAVLEPAETGSTGCVDHALRWCPHLFRAFGSEEPRDVPSRPG